MSGNLICTGKYKGEEWTSQSITRGQLTFHKCQINELNVKKTKLV